MGQQVSVETFASTKDENGNKYWTSFDPYPFKVGSKKLAYMGLLNGDGPMAGQKCVVKTIRDSAIDKSDWMLESRRSKVARTLANDYNKMQPRDATKITFNVPIIAEIDTMSDCLCLNDILGKPKKKWDDCEAVSIETYLKGKFEDFEFGWVKESDLLVPEAFTHFSWCQSKGSMLVSNLQGVKSDNVYRLTGPVINSELKEFGSSDLGHEGIKCFFKYHQCNRICRGWPRLGDGINLTGWGESRTQEVHDRRPSAPIPPPYVYDSPPIYSPQPPSHSSNFRAQTNSDVSPRPHNSHNVSLCRDRNMQPNHVITMSQIRSSLIIDQRQGFISSNYQDGRRQNHDNPYFHDTFEMQLLWLVKEMSYAMYSSPPPPYCRCAERPRNDTPELQHRDKYSAEDYFYDDDDEKPLLPPAYSKENISSRSEITYL